MVSELVYEVSLYPGIFIYQDDQTFEFFLIHLYRIRFAIYVLCPQVALLEWTDDMEVFILKGYGNSLNYRMGVPLLQDIVQSMEKAITAKEGTHTS